MRKKRQEFMHLKQGGRYVHDYSKQFNHLAQYASDQVNMNVKKKDHFMIGLSTKLQECMSLNTGGTFLEFVSNVMIVDDLHPQGDQEEEGYGCSIRQYPPKVPDGVPLQLHLSTSTVAPASAFAAAVGSPPTSAPASAGST
jgi:hypothetical protein